MIIYLLLVFLVIGYTYLGYPILLKTLTRLASPNQVHYGREELPAINILLAVHNEEDMIAMKIKNCFEGNYPADKIKLFIGSDGSLDKTVSIIETINHPNVRLGIFERMGKGNVLNELVMMARPDQASVFVFTDVNVLFAPDALYEMVKHFKHERVGLVGAWINNRPSDAAAAYQENFYIQQENELKYAEGLLGGNMVGAFGAAYAIRASLYPAVPKNFITDDLFIATHIALSKFACIMEPNSVAEEIIHPTEESEFRRKRRFAAGNFQVLFYFLGRYVNNLSFAFCFFSHKVLRWKIPMMLAAGLVGLFITKGETILHLILFVFMLILCLSPIWNKFLIKRGIEIKIAKFTAYFIKMNLAIGMGFLNYLKGIETNVWQPTKRN